MSPHLTHHRLAPALRFGHSGVLAPRRGASPPGALRAFTLVELLVVVAIITLLAGLLLPTLSRARSKVQATACLNNLRQLQAALILYGTENNDYVVWNEAEVRRSWVYTAQYYRATPSPAGLTNTQWLVDRAYAGFADYIQTPATYHCPADRTTVPPRAKRVPWVRSYGAKFRQRKLSEFDRTLAADGTPQSPSAHYTFDDVHPGFLVDLNGASASADQFGVFPASWHGKAGAFAFVDGHVEIHRWRDGRTVLASDAQISFTPAGGCLPIRSPGNPDAQWLSAHNDNGIGYAKQDQDVIRGVASGE